MPRQRDGPSGIFGDMLPANYRLECCHEHCVPFPVIRLFCSTGRAMNRVLKRRDENLDRHLVMIVSCKCLLTLPSTRALEGTSGTEKEFIVFILYIGQGSLTCNRTHTIFSTSSRRRYQGIADHHL